MMQPEEHSEGLTFWHKWGKCCDEYDRCPRGNTSKESSTVEELLELFHDIDSTKDKMFKVYPDLERSLTICQSLQNMLAQYVNLYKKASSIQTTICNFFKEMILSQCF